MKHKQFGILNLMCGKQGRKGRRKLSVELEYYNTEQSYFFGLTFRLIFFFLGIAIDIEKKSEDGKNGEKSVSQETTDDGSV
jgi:hypothetical protein